MDDLYVPNGADIAEQAEYGLIGCLLMEPETTLRLIRGEVEASDFQKDACRAIYIAAANLSDSGRPCDVIQIQEEARKLGLKLDGEFCKEVTQIRVPVGNAAVNAKLIHQAAIDLAGQNIGNALKFREVTPLEALAQLQELLRTQRGTVKTPLDVAQSFMNYVVDASEGKIKPFLSTGFRDLDKQLAGGLIASGLITIAARPNMGKTTCGIAIADNIAATGKAVLYVSLEMDSNQIWAKRTASLSGLNSSAILRGELKDEDQWRRLYDAANILSKRPFFIRDIPSTIDEIEREARCTDNLSLLVIDHLGLIQPSPGSKGSRYELITGLSHRLKQLALSLHIPVLILCQLNRANEQRPDKTPNLADLRDSGAVEEDSDVVCLLYRPAYYSAEELRPKPWETQDIDFIVAKNRHGMVGTVTMSFVGINSRIMERRSYL